jgi:hypothetical protein
MMNGGRRETPYAQARHGGLDGVVSRRAQARTGASKVAFTIAFKVSSVVKWLVFAQNFSART